ncbi:histidine phosphatase family protein [Mucilaginibacter aquatilis]|nr:histidine phosphatase family protein [Mucilaginibacter aquatilis]
MTISRFIHIILFTFASSMAFAQEQKGGDDLRIIIMRHAEKPANGDNLSCKGFNRAMMLPGVLVKKFGVPRYVYVPSPSTGKATKSGRMLQTVWPLATKYNLTVNSKFDVENTKALAKNISNKTGTVLVVWEHNAIRSIIAALGIKADKLKWKSNDYDSLWIVSIHNGKASLQQTAQGINAPDGCRF